METLTEPTSNLDLRNQLEVLKTVHEIAHENNISVIIVIHDLNLSLRYCDKFMFLKDRRKNIYLLILEYKTQSLHYPTRVIIMYYNKMCNYFEEV